MIRIPIPISVGVTETIKVHIVPYACACNIFVSVVYRDVGCQLWQYTRWAPPAMVGYHEFEEGEGPWIG